MGIPGPSDALKGAPWGPQAGYTKQMQDTKPGYDFWLGHNGLFPVIVTPTTQAFEMAQTAMHELELSLRDYIGINSSAPTLAQKIRDWYDLNGTDLTVMYPVAGCLPAPLERIALALFPGHNITEDFIGPMLNSGLRFLGYGERMDSLYLPQNGIQESEIKEFASANGLPYRLQPLRQYNAKDVAAPNLKALPI